MSAIRGLHYKYSNLSRKVQKNYGKWHRMAIARFYSLNGIE